MARMNHISEVENQIQKKQEKLFKLKEQSDAIAEEIEALLKEKKDAQREAMLDALENSGRSYEEVMEFLKSAPKRSVPTAGRARRGRPKKDSKAD